MKIGFVTTEKIADNVKDIIDKEFEEIELSILIYNSYEDVLDLLKQHQNKFDAIVFAGYFPYYQAKLEIKRNIPWYYFSLKGGALEGALLRACSLGYNIKKVSFEGNREIIEAVYKEYNIEYENLCVIYDIDDLYEIDNLLYEKVDIIEEIFLFHKENYYKGCVDYCLTTSSQVHKMLEDEGIPHAFVYPSNNRIREIFSNIYLKHIAKINQNSQVIALAIKIDTPDEYSISIEDEYNFILEKERIEEEIYLFAHKIKAAVVQTSIGNYLLFSTKKVLEVETNYFRDIDLFKYVEKKTRRSIIMGIGYGESVIEAKYNSYKGLKKSEKVGKNTAYIIYEDGSVNGPIHYGSKDESKSNIVDEKLLNIAIKSQLSINTILKLYGIMNKLKQDTFTSKELANIYGISSRSMNRILLKLEDAGFVEVVGKKVILNSGRPSRIIKLKFN